MPTTTSTTLVTTVLTNRKGSTRLPANLPWGASLRGLTVSEFAKNFEAHLPLIRSKLNNPPPEQTIRAICNDLGESSLAFNALIVMLRQARSEMKRRKISKKLGHKRQQKREDHDAATSSANEDRNDAEEQSDPVGAAVDFLLGLIGM